MLESLRLRHFKSFEDQTVPLAPLTLLVGANASGKSNLLDALRFLQGTALDLTIAEVFRGRMEGGRELWTGIRGGAAEAARGEASDFVLTSNWDFEGSEVMHCLGCTTGKHPHVNAERLTSSDPGRYLFDTEADSLGEGRGLQDGGGLAVGLRRRGKGRAIPVTLSSQRSLLGQVKAEGPADPNIATRSKQLRAALRGMFFLDITPRRMREYVPLAAQSLGAQGENLSAVVYELCQEEARKLELIDWLSELCAPTVENIEFVQTELGDLMLQLVEQDGTKVSARSLSDGTLRFLGELVALLTAPPGSLVLIEEIENGLHPTRAALLVELLTQIIQDRGVQVVATTHSPLVLEALARVDEDVLRRAVLLARVPELSGSQARALGDLPHFGEVLERRGIERLFTTKWLERAL